MNAWPVECKIRLNFRNSSSNNDTDTGWAAESHDSGLMLHTDAAGTDNQSPPQENTEAVSEIASSVDLVNTASAVEVDGEDSNGTLDTNLITQDSDTLMDCALDGQFQGELCSQEETQARLHASETATDAVAEPLATTSRGQLSTPNKETSHAKKYSLRSKERMNYKCDVPRRSSRPNCVPARYSTLLVRFSHDIYAEYYKPSKKWNHRNHLYVNKHTNIKQPVRKTKCRQDCSVLIAHEVLLDIDVEVTRWLKRLGPPMKPRRIKKLLRALSSIQHCLASQQTCNTQCLYKVNGRKRQELLELTETLSYKLSHTFEASQKSDIFQFNEATSIPLGESLTQSYMPSLVDQMEDVPIQLSSVQSEKLHFIQPVLTENVEFHHALSTSSEQYEKVHQSQSLSAQKEKNCQALSTSPEQPKQVHRVLATSALQEKFHQAMSTSPEQYKQVHQSQSLSVQKDKNCQALSTSSEQPKQVHQAQAMPAQKEKVHKVMSTSSEQPKQVHQAESMSVQKKNFYQAMSTSSEQPKRFNQAQAMAAQKEKVHQVMSTSSEQPKHVHQGQAMSALQEKFHQAMSTSSEQPKQAHQAESMSVQKQKFYQAMSTSSEQPKRFHQAQAMAEQKEKVHQVMSTSSEQPKHVHQVQAMSALQEKFHQAMSTSSEQPKQAHQAQSMKVQKEKFYQAMSTSSEQPKRFHQAQAMSAQKEKVNQVMSTSSEQPKHVHQAQAMSALQDKVHQAMSTSSEQPKQAHQAQAMSAQKEKFYQAMSTSSEQPKHVHQTLSMSEQKDKFCQAMPTSSEQHKQVHNAQPTSAEKENVHYIHPTSGDKILHQSQTLSTENINFNHIKATTQQIPVNKNKFHYILSNSPHHEQIHTAQSMSTQNEKLHNSLPTSQQMKQVHNQQLMSAPNKKFHYALPRLSQAEQDSHVQPMSTQFEQLQLSQSLLSNYQLSDVQSISAHREHLKNVQAEPTKYKHQSVKSVPAGCNQVEYAQSLPENHRVEDLPKKKRQKKQKSLTVKDQDSNSAYENFETMDKRVCADFLSDKKKCFKSGNRRDADTDSLIVPEVASQGISQAENSTKMYGNEQECGHMSKLGTNAKQNIHELSSGQGIAGTGERRVAVRGRECGPPLGLPEDAVCLPEGRHRLFAWASRIRGYYFHPLLVPGAGQLRPCTRDTT